MKRILILLLAGWLAGGAPAAAQMGERGITVTGTATLSLTPDTARLYFGVVTVDKTLEGARSRNAALMQRVTAALQALKLPASKTTTRPDGSLETTAGLALRTGDLTVELIYADRASQVEPPVIVGYRVTNSAVARYNDRDAERLGTTMSRIVDTVLKAGANQVGRVEFSLRDEGEAEQRAMVAALANARMRADTLAREAGVRLRGVRTITQTTYQFQPRAYMMNQIGGFGGAGGGAGGTPLVAGTLLFSGSVGVTYDIAGG